MLRGAFDAEDAQSPAALEAAYLEVLRETVTAVGIDATVERSGLDPDLIEQVAAGEDAALTLEEAAGILAVDPQRPPAETLAAEARDLLLMGMTTAVVDVDSLSSALDGRLEPKEIQQKVEGRRQMTLSEYALLHQHLAAAAR